MNDDAPNFPIWVVEEALTDGSTVWNVEIGG